MKPHADSPKFERSSITGIGSYLGLCNPQAAIDLEYLASEEDYPNFNVNIPSSSVPSSVTNYIVPGWGQIPLAIQYPEGTTNYVRYPNNRISVPGTFIVKGSGIKRRHFVRTSDETGNNIPFLIVNTAQRAKPTFGYKICFDNVCSSNRDYSEYFSHGTFIGTTISVYEPDRIADEFVKDITLQMNASGIVNDFNTTFSDARYKTDKVYESKNQ